MVTLAVLRAIALSIVSILSRTAFLDGAIVVTQFQVVASYAVSDMFEACSEESARSRLAFTLASSLVSSIEEATIEAVILGVQSLYVKSISALSVIIVPTASCAISSVY